MRRCWGSIYRALIRLLPAEFRARHAADLGDVFDRITLGTTGARRHVRAMRECADLAAVAIRLRLTSRQRRRGERRVRVSAFDAWSRDFAYATRALWRSPGFTLSTITTLGLGIGASAAIFNLSYNLWLKPLPYANARELVSIRDAYSGLGATVSAPEVAAYRAAPSLAGLAAYHYGAVITGGAEPARLVAYGVTPDLFDLLGVTPRLGRGFVREDAGASQSSVALISDRLWRRRFNADPRIVGRSFALREGALTIVGVMPPGFEFPLDLPSDLWRPFDLEGWGADRNARMLMTVGRLRAGASLERAVTEISLVGRQLADAYPATNRGWTPVTSRIVDEVVGPYERAFQFLLGAVAVLLCIACANIASLFMARRLMRERELAIRTALGATAWRIRRMVMAESLLLAVGAGMVGMVVALGTATSLAGMLPSSLPRLANVESGVPIVASALAVSMLTGLLCGLSPAGGLGPSIAARLRDGRRTTWGTGPQRLRSSLVVGEVALSLVLLVTAGLMGRALLRVSHTDHGFDPNGLLTLHVSLPFEQYQDAATRAAAFDRIAERLGSVPGARAAATVTGYPSSSMGTLGGGPLGARVPGTVSPVTAILRAASPGYFSVMRTPVVAGRAFSGADRTGAPPVAIVTESLAREYWNGEPAVGKPLVIPAAMTGEQGADVTVTVVGVVADMRLGSRATPSLFVPLAQRPPYWTDVVVRASADPATIAGAVKRALLETDSKLLIEQVEPMTAILADRLALDRTQSVLAALFGALATLLSAVGLYGLLTHLVAERVQEIGVRRAMGAQRSDILRLVLSRGLTLAAVGALVGTAGALAFQRILGSRIFGLSAFDARVVLVAAVGLIAIAFVACYLPARRAMRIDPMVALR